MSSSSSSSSSSSYREYSSKEIASIFFSYDEDHNIVPPLIAATENKLLRDNLALCVRQIDLNQRIANGDDINVIMIEQHEITAMLALIMARAQRMGVIPTSTSSTGLLAF